jgi:transketolase
MRTAFINELIIQARLHPDIFLIVGDLGFSVVEPFIEEFPDRFLNAGIAEQNMTGMAAGLASEGYHVFTYSIANFPTLRCIEQFRNDVCYHNLPVTIVAVGAGLSYGNLGYSHHAVQDIACLRGMPNIKLMSPADPGETRTCLQNLVKNPSPSYLRLGKAGEPDLHHFENASLKPILIKGAVDAPCAIIATGSILAVALAAASQENQIAVYSLPMIAPINLGSLESLWNHQALITLEEHVRDGGIGEMIASYRPNGISQQILSIKGDLSHVVGSQQALRTIHGIDTDEVNKAVASILASLSPTPSLS